MTLTTYLQKRISQKKTLLMTHLIVGYPSIDANRQMLDIMESCGVDLIELQWPFSEPIADGPLFVKANQEALLHGVTRDSYWRFFEEASTRVSAPLFMMGYYNPVFQMGHAAFCNTLKQAGGVGFILPDLPIENYETLWPLSRAQELASIMLLTPTNTLHRLQTLADHGSGFLYCVARKGVTGSHTQLGNEVDTFLQQCRAVSTLPLAVGFGLSSPQDLQLIEGKAEITVIGSALLRVWEQQGSAAYHDYLKQLTHSL